MVVDKIYRVVKAYPRQIIADPSKIELRVGRFVRVESISKDGILVAYESNGNLNRITLTEKEASFHLKEN